MNRFRLAAVALLSILALAGCISTSMEIDLNSDGSGDISLLWEFDEALYDVGVFDGSDVARPIPVTRHEFEEAALVTGMRLSSYRYRVNDGLVRVTARLRFASPDQLAGLLGPDQLSIDLSPGGGSFRYLLAPAGDPELVSPALAEDLAASTITLVIDPPEPVQQTNGEVLDNGRVVFSVTLQDLAATADEVAWEIAW